MRAEARLRAAAREVRRALAGVLGLWREVVLVAAALGGWALMTWGVASLLVWQVWPISAGLFLFAFVAVGLGRKPRSTIAAEGLYRLTGGGSRA